MADDYNVNDTDHRNTNISYCGYQTAEIATGAYGCMPYTAYASGNVGFKNCQWWFCYGFGLASTASSTGRFHPRRLPVERHEGLELLASGTGVANQGNTTLIGCFSDGCDLYDVYTSYATMTVIGGNFVSGGTASFWVNGSSGRLNLIGTTTSNGGNASKVCVSLNGGSVTWNGCQVNENTFVSGVATPAQAEGIGTSTLGANTNTSVAAVASTPTVASGTGTAISLASDAMLYMTCTTLGTGFSFGMAAEIAVTVASGSERWGNLDHRLVGR